MNQICCEKCKVKNGKDSHERKWCFNCPCHTLKKCEGETHHACKEMLEKTGGKTPCCACTNHQCKPSPAYTEEWEKSFDKRFLNPNAVVYGGNLLNEQCKKRIEYQTEEIKSFIRSTLAAQKQRIVEAGEKEIKWLKKSSMYPAHGLNSEVKALTSYLQIIKEL